MKARELIQEGETAVIVFTKGENFHVDDDGRGSTGHWLMDPTRTLDKVIIYRRDPETQRNDVYVAIPTGVSPSPHEDRHIIEFAEARYVGTTAANWYAFAEGGPNPVRYLTG